MATKVSGIGTSHTPTVGFALATHKQNDPIWALIFEGYRPVQRSLAEKKPNVLFCIYNDRVFVRHWDTWNDHSRNHLFALTLGPDGKATDNPVAGRMGHQWIPGMAKAGGL